MDPIEESLRRALEGGDPADPGFRQSIYAASERAMERMIDGRGLDEERAGSERARLSEVMDRVEAEYSAYYDRPDVREATGGQPETAETWTADHETWEAGGPEPYARPAGEQAAEGGARTPGAYAAPAAVQADAEADIWKPGAGRPSRARRAGAGRKLLVAVLLLLGVGAILWIVSALFMSSEAQTPAEQTSSQPAASEPTGDLAQQTPPDDITWIDVFSGADLEQISAPSGIRVASIDTAERPAVRLSAPETADGSAAGESEILINLGPGLVGELAGADIRVELVAGSPDDAVREFSVRCLFGENSICDRQRFATSVREEAFVFDVEIPEDASTPANIAIGPGLSATGGDVDLYSVRVRVL